MEIFPSPDAPSSHLVRARNISLALSEAARVARFAPRAKGNFVSGGFQARRGAGVMRLAVIGSLLVCVVLPSLSSAFYYAFLASDQYVSQARFSVTVNQAPQLDTIGALTGLASAAIIRDTQIVTSYIASRAAVDALSQRIDLRRRYSDPRYDFAARSDPSMPIEKFVRYWNGMVSTSISMPAGIVELSVKAFTPDDARLIARTVIELSEELINEQNDRINHDAMTNALAELQRSSVRLANARAALEKARNESGVIDAEKSNDALNLLLTETRGKLIALQQEYATKSKLISPSMPQMRVLKERIEGLSNQIAEIEGTVTSSKQGASSLSSTMTRLSELELEKQISERLFAGASANLEVARLLSEQKQMYINTFV